MKKISVDNILFLMLMAIVPTVLVIIISFIFFILSGGKNEVVQSLVVLPFSFILIPGIILSRQEKVCLEELGIKKFSRKDVVICTTCCLVLYTYLLLKYEIRAIVLLSVQMFIVAISEEFWARGVLFYILRKIFSNWYVVVLISSVIFVFVTHMNRDLIENLLYRMPGALIMGFIYQKTEKLQYSILFHYVYNILGSL